MKLHACNVHVYVNFALVRARAQNQTVWCTTSVCFSNTAVMVIWMW